MENHSPQNTPVEFPPGIEETWRADAAEQRVSELQHENAILLEILHKMYGAPSDCSCAPPDETLAIWDEARSILLRNDHL